MVPRLFRLFKLIEKPASFFLFRVRQSLELREELLKLVLILEINLIQIDPYLLDHALLQLVFESEGAECFSLLLSQNHFFFFYLLHNMVKPTLLIKVLCFELVIYLNFGLLFYADALALLNLFGHCALIHVVHVLIAGNLTDVIMEGSGVVGDLWGVNRLLLGRRFDILDVVEAILEGADFVHDLLRLVDVHVVLEREQLRL